VVIGAGSAGTTIARCFQQDGRAVPVGFCEPVPGQRERVRALCPEALVGEDYREVLAGCEPDLVVVAGPDHLHADHAVTALEHGCHVLIEKPMATTVADVRRILAAEAQAGTQVMVDFTMRYSHPWGTMARAARAGEVGRVFFLEGNYVHDMWHHYHPQGRYHTPWRVDRDNPQNILLGGGCHGLDLMLWAMHDVPVREVSAYSNHLSAGLLPADDCYLVAMRFADGTIGKLYVTSGCNGAEFGRFLEVYGADGTLREGKLFRRDQEPVELAVTGRGSAGGHGWPGTVKDFLDVLTEGVPNPVPTVMGARNVAVCEAALRSAREGGARPVEWFA
jgi:predicted dehydrogenase